jgi:cytochrome P450
MLTRERCFKCSRYTSLFLREPLVTQNDSTVRANKAENPSKRLAEHEVLAQMSTLIQAGHHTTAFTLAWILCELSRHSHDQQKIYEEIQRARVKRHGDLIAEDYDELSEGWLGACVKVRVPAK